MHIKYIIFGIALLCISTLKSQEIKGYIKDKQTNEVIPFVKISLIDFDVHTISDIEGYFEFVINLPEKVKVKISSINYKTLITTISKKESNLIFLEESHLELDEIVVSTGKNSLLKNNVTPIELKKLNELKLIPTSNMGEALNNVVGVYNSSTGNGISKPVIRGLQGNQVVTYLNGLRIENQQFGGDHGMGISDLGIDQVEIIKGPSSLQFGADALGGVLYFSDDSYAKQNTTELQLQSQFETNTIGTNNRIEFKKATQKIRCNLSALYANHADYRLPNNKFAGNSRFSEYSFKGALSFNKNKSVHHLRYNISRNVVGIPGHTHDTIIVFKKFQYQNQKRNFATPVQVILNNFLSFESKYFFRKSEFNSIIGFTNNSLTEFEEKITIPAIKMNLSNYLYHFKYKFNFTENFNVLFGLQGMLQFNKNDNRAIEFLIPNGQILDNGIYTILNYEFKKWNLQAGSRLDVRNLSTDEVFKGNPALKRDFNNQSYSFGAVHNTKFTKLRFNVSNAFRSPNFNELLSNGIHHGSLRYEIGNPNLKKEQATQVDLLFDYHNDHIALTVNPFFTDFQNYIYVEPSDSFVGAYQLFNYKQEKKVQIYGIDLGLHFHPHFAHFLHVESSFSTIKFETQNQNSISLIPQNRINTFLKIDLPNVNKVKLKKLVLQHTYYFAQNSVSLFETASKAFQVFNAALNFELNKKNKTIIDVGFKNFLNENYINHLSRLKNIQLPNPGWNLYFSIKYQISKQHNNN